MEEYKLWLDKANDDLLWTKHNLDAKVYYGACFTAQQSAEKALKGFLLFYRKPLRKIHDLVTLVDDCAIIDSDFVKIRELCATLSTYYIETRYPIYEEFERFTEEKAREAYKYTEEIVRFIEEKVATLQSNG